MYTSRRNVSACLSNSKWSGLVVVNQYIKRYTLCSLSWKHNSWKTEAACSVCEIQRRCCIPSLAYVCPLETVNNAVIKERSV